MTFDDILAQVITLLKRQGRVSYRALKMRFELEDEYLEVLWYLPEYKIVIISITYANMSLSPNIGRASSSAQDL